MSAAETILSPEAADRRSSGLGPALGSEPEPPMCCECHTRRCESEDDEICQHCWDEHLWECNMKRELRIAAGWRVDGTGAVFPPNDPAHRPGATTQD